jgi:hypothetical protein
MKTTSIELGLVVLLAAALSAVADNKPKDTKAEKPVLAEKDKKATAKTYGEVRKERLTGSYIKQDIRREGLITDGPNLVQVIDSGMIRRSGAATVQQVLVNTGIH